MKALVNTEPGKLELRDYPKPEPGSDQVRIKTGACGICATDLTMIDGCERSFYPAVPGHEWSGMVDKTGSGVDSGITGKHCVAENVLEDGSEVGFEHPGGYCEYFITESNNIHILPPDFPLITAALIEPLAVSVRARKRLSLENPSRALIFGDGPIGLIMLMLLRKAGIDEIVVVGGREERLAIAEELGATHIYNYHELHDTLSETIKDTTGGNFPNIIEASGSESAIRAALTLTGRGGHILAMGEYSGINTDFNWQNFLLRELMLTSSNASADAWPEAVRLAVSHEITLERLVTHIVPAGEFEKAFEIVRSKKNGCIKVVLDWMGK